jgi:hypothetical protein
MVQVWYVLPATIAASLAKASPVRIATPVIRSQEGPRFQRRSR